MNPETAKAEMQDCEMVLRGNHIEFTVTNSEDITLSGTAERSDATGRWLVEIPLVFPAGYIKEVMWSNVYEVPYDLGAIGKMVAAAVRSAVDSVHEWNHG